MVLSYKNVLASLMTLVCVVSAEENSPIGYELLGPARESLESLVEEVDSKYPQEEVETVLDLVRFEYARHSDDSFTLWWASNNNGRIYAQLIWRLNWDASHAEVLGRILDEHLDVNGRTDQSDISYAAWRLILVSRFYAYDLTLGSKEYHFPELSHLYTVGDGTGPWRRMPTSLLGSAFERDPDATVNTFLFTPLHPEAEHPEQLFANKEIIESVAFVRYASVRPDRATILQARQTLTELAGHESPIVRAYVAGKLKQLRETRGLHDDIHPMDPGDDVYQKLLKDDDRVVHFLIKRMASRRERQ